MDRSDAPANLGNQGNPLRDSIEVKLDESLKNHKRQILALVWFNAVRIASHGTDSRIGWLAADQERFFKLKRICRSCCTGIIATFSRSSTNSRLRNLSATGPT
jgi:hypothetical protein